MVIQYLLSAAIAYLLGAIPSGILVARAHGDVDILRVGSRKTGTTNILRTLGWRAAGVVFAGDFAKGAVAVAVARLITGGDPTAEVVAGLVSILGHTYSVFIGFKGGRGVATGVGALLVIAPVAGFIAAMVAFSVMAATRYVSLGSILGACSAPISLAVLVFANHESPVRLLYALIGATFVVATHRDNIGRLISGTERKLGERVQT